MKIKKIIVCLLAVLILSSCTVINHTHGTTAKEDIVTEPTTESAADATENLPKETAQKKYETEKLFIINKNTKKYHSEDCHYVRRMNEENKMFVNSTPERLQSQSYSPCSYCQKS